MVKPTQPKSIKPQSEAKAPSETVIKPNIDSGLKTVVINAVTSILICLLFVGSNYFIMKGTMDKAVKQIVANSSGAGSEEGGDASAAEEPLKPGPILDLGDFILNLSDQNAKRYLKINVALQLTRLDTDPDPSAEAKGGHGEGAKSAPNPAEDLARQYMPAIRDAVISTLSSKTAEELSSVAGKELAKEQIKNAVDAILGGEREVERVSFGNFIIQ